MIQLAIYNEQISHETLRMEYCKQNCHLTKNNLQSQVSAHYNSNDILHRTRKNNSNIIVSAHTHLK